MTTYTLAFLGLQKTVVHRGKGGTFILLIACDKLIGHMEKNCPRWRATLWKSIMVCRSAHYNLHVL